MRKASALSVVPGAIVCPSYDQTSELFDLYAHAWEEQAQDVLTRGESALLRGRAAPAPIPERYGCVLIGSGDPLYVERGNIVPVVHAKVRGVWIRGVTLPSMLSLDSETPKASTGQYVTSHAVDQAQLTQMEAKEAAEGPFTVALGDVSSGATALTPSLQRITLQVKRNWLPLLPEGISGSNRKEGEVLIQVALHPDGSIASMKLEKPSSDKAIDRACWAAITSVGQFHVMSEGSMTTDAVFQLRFGINQRTP